MTEMDFALKCDVETDNLFQQKCYLLNEAIQDVVAATTFGTLCNYCTFIEGGADPSVTEEKKEPLQKDQSIKSYSTLSWDRKGFLNKNRGKTSPKHSNIRGGGEAWEKINKLEEVGKNGGGFIPASVRLRWLQDGNNHLKFLLTDLQTYILSMGHAPTSEESKKSETELNEKGKLGIFDHGGDKKEEEWLNAKEKEKRESLAALRGRVNRNLFVNHCDLSLKPSEFMPSFRGIAAKLPPQKGVNERFIRGEAAAQIESFTADLLRQLTEATNRAGKLRGDVVARMQAHTSPSERGAESRLFHASSPEEKSGLVKNGEKDSTATSTPQEQPNPREGARRLCGALQVLQNLLQKNLQGMFEQVIKAGIRANNESNAENSSPPSNVLTELMVASSNGYRGETSLLPACSELTTLPSLIKELAAWPEPLFDLINSCFSAASPAEVVEAPRERLKRLAFDVEGLQLEQERAVTDGDMQRSEEIYYQQTTLLNSMVPIFTALEKALEALKIGGVSKPLEKIATLRGDFLNRCEACLKREEDALNRVRNDREKLLYHQKRLSAIRAGQVKGLENYFEEWDSLYNTSVTEQAGCLRTMEQLERRMRDLCKEQQFLVQDRLLRLKEEYQRREDAAAFESFANEHNAVLTSAEETLARLVENIKTYNKEIQRGYDHLEAFLCNDLANEIDEELLQVHKDRLEQFRHLYNTLGDLQFKKARHLEEVDKKISNYEMYQEVAMDTLNPKAKVYSQAKKSWESVQKEVQQQLEGLNRQCEAEIAAFKRTEQALLMAGVAFTNPVEEVAARHAQRQRRLLEYRQLMETEVDGRGREKEGGGGGTPRPPAAVAPSRGREMAGSSRPEAGPSSPPAGSRRLPFLFALKGKSTRGRRDGEAAGTPRPSSRQSESTESRGGVSSSPRSGAGVPTRGSCLYATEERAGRRSPIGNGKK